MFLARALGFEPRSKVLETRMLPLHHARIKAKSYFVLPKQLLEYVANI
jgi:pyrroloquinoline quinone (PQQ) biosynthesis protein C